MASRTRRAFFRFLRPLRGEREIDHAAAEELQVMLKARAARQSMQGWDELDRALARLRWTGGNWIG